MNAIQAQSGGSNGFFSDITATIGSVSKELLPIWAAKQLGLQTKDQLANSTYNADGTPKLNQGQSTTAQFFSGNAGWIGPAMVIGGLAIVGIVAYKALK